MSVHNRPKHSSDKSYNRIDRGLAEYIKTNINSRIMIDPLTFRRINPNYDFSAVRRDPDLLPESDGEQCDCGSSDDEGPKKSRKVRQKIIEDSDGEERIVDVPPEDMTTDQKFTGGLVNFTDDDYLICSPVVPGFSFADKLWVEFDVAPGGGAVTGFSLVVDPPAVEARARKTGGGIKMAADAWFERV